MFGLLARACYLRAAARAREIRCRSLARAAVATGAAGTELIARPCWFGQHRPESTSTRHTRGAVAVPLGLEHGGRAATCSPPGSTKWCSASTAPTTTPTWWSTTTTPSSDHARLLLTACEGQPAGSAIHRGCRQSSGSSPRLRARKDAVDAALQSANVPLTVHETRRNPARTLQTRRSVAIPVVSAPSSSPTAGRTASSRRWAPRAESPSNA
jgi:hypothetical protein